MFVFFTITDFASIEMFLVSIPESLGLLAFGIGLVTVAVIGRWLLARSEESKDEKKITKKAEVR